MPHWDADYIAEKAIFWQQQAALDHLHGQGFSERDLQGRIEWQRFYAEASARSREYLFELVGRGAQ